MNKLKRLILNYADTRIQRVVAGMVVDDEAAEFAQSIGMWVIAPSGKTVAMKKAPNFIPLVW